MSVLQFEMNYSVTEPNVFIQAAFWTTKLVNEEERSRDRGHIALRSEKRFFCPMR